MNLLELTKGAKALEELIEGHLEANGNLDGVEAIIDAWSHETDDAIEAKYEAIARLYRQWNAIAEAQKAEAKHLAAKAKANEARAERLKSWAALCMSAEGVASRVAGPYTFAIVSNGGAAPLVLASEDPAKFPERYRRTKVELDKDAIKSGIDAGNEDIADLARYGERGRSLRIK